MFIRFPQAYAWGYDLAPASRAPSPQAELFSLDFAWENDRRRSAGFVSPFLAA